jgi:hypothetical protein
VDTTSAQDASARWAIELCRQAHQLDAQPDDLLISRREGFCILPQQSVGEPAVAKLVQMPVVEPAIRGGIWSRLRAGLRR